MTEESIMLEEVAVNNQPSTDTEETMPCFQTPGPTVTFHNLRYRVKERLGMFSRQWVDKDILKDVSGIMNPGMNAIMGPTGSGKTSLLDVIAGRKDPKGLKSGQVLVDNTIVTSELRLCSAYVVQSDILMGTLTVRENLAFSANLRLSRKEYSSADKEMRVDSVIQELGLKDCADTKIGTMFLRGVSGGEKKRCSIGMELITSPSLLFLDEPTTGLDANTANSIMELLQKLSKKGKTIIFSIHQPRYSIFSQFDHLTLINKGEIIYAGAANKAITYFEDLGYKCEPFNNPADFFLDVTNGTILPQKHNNKSEKCSSSEEMVENENPLAVIYRKSPYFLKVKDQLSQISDGLDPEVTKGDRVGYATPFCYQIKTIITRFTCRHETSSGFYRTSAYFLSKVFADLIPNRILPVFIFSAIPYFMMGLKPDVEAFFLYCVTMSMVSLAAVSLAFLVSATVGSFAMANILIALPYVVMMVFGGFLVNLNSMLSGMSWLKWASIFRYGYNALAIIELKDQVFTSNYTR
ncbi:ATP-binding cassette sub-family G member 2-like isoform X2 [Labeo rohita]|uniref:ATP-binding cassette sub-family G member 2-like isoform X2 n=1 Tax=Labeo rohita TaxID=84645 RepID=A0A498N7F3_LABRO|nr:ATP-binding cassette sub-family G member 2-like isoform X2 [Labeo rohita]